MAFVIEMHVPLSIHSAYCQKPVVVERGEQHERWGFDLRRMKSSSGTKRFSAFYGQRVVWAGTKGSFRRKFFRKNIVILQKRQTERR